MTDELNSLDRQSLSPDATAILLDLDGTVSAIADRPADAIVTPQVRHILESLRQSLSGALAIVSGRSIADVDQMLSPARLPVAGTHGTERRDATGRIHRFDVDLAALEAVTSSLETATADTHGLLVEKKPGAVTLHYRTRPDLEELCEQLTMDIVAQRPELTLLRGKMVFEIKMTSRTKADAVREFMSELPFSGRRPIYAGDDRTDEDAFEAVRELEGIGIKIGDGRTAAGYRCPGMDDFVAWLALLSEELNDTISARQ